MGIYIPPNCMTGLDDLQVAWEVCPADCTPLVVGDLNICFEDPADNRADAIVDLLEEININNLPHIHTLMVQPAVEMGMLDLLHVEDRGVVLLAAGLPTG
jgi:hypothetical protein